MTWSAFLLQFGGEGANDIPAWVVLYWLFVFYVRPIVPFVLLGLLVMLMVRAVTRSSSPGDDNPATTTGGQSATTEALKDLNQVIAELGSIRTQRNDLPADAYEQRIALRDRYIELQHEAAQLRDHSETSRGMRVHAGEATS